MVANLFRNIFFSVLIFLITYQNVAIASQNINLNLSPQNAYVDETTTFTIEFSSEQNLSNVIMHFYVDAEKIGAKELFDIEGGKKYFITFDYFFNRNLYLGEHYIELKTEFETENQEKGSKYIYSVVDVYDKRPSAILKTILLFLLNIVALFRGVRYLKGRNTNIIKFDPEDRRILFNIIVTVLPISLSTFTLYLTEKPELKIGLLSILLSFIISFILAIYSYLKAEKKSDVKANNFTLFSLCFLFLGVTEMVMLALVF